MGRPESEETVTFIYKNYKGVVASRKVKPIKIWYGTTQWYKEKQWLVWGYDYHKNDYRDFALKDIKNWDKY